MWKDKRHFVLPFGDPTLFNFINRGEELFALGNKAIRHCKQLGYVSAISFQSLDSKDILSLISLQ